MQPGTRKLASGNINNNRPPANRRNRDNLFNLSFIMKSFIFNAMKRILQLSLIVLYALLISGCSGRQFSVGIPVKDGFESPAISNLWETDKIIPTDAIIQSSLFRSGQSAIQITLHTSDRFEAGRNGSLDSERAELTEAERLISQQGKTYVHCFSMFIPKDFPIVDTRLVIAQWKQECPGGNICDDNSPVLAIRYISGALFITQTIGPRCDTLWLSHDEFRDRWLDFKFLVRFETNEKGRISAHLNDSLIVNYSGPTAYKEDASTGYPAPSRFYFKMGLYRDTMTEPMTIFIDDYSKEMLRNNQQ
jgi:hypothetical protein